MPALLNTDALTWAATNDLLKLDKTFRGTDDYMGIAYFWHYEYRHFLRDASYARRRRVHAALLRAGLDVAAASPAHDTIIRKITR
jgi:hypothetical protein